MIEHIWSVLCRNAVIDVETNNVSIHDVLEQVAINAEPIENGVLPLPFELIILWGRMDNDKPSKGHGKVTFVPPSGNTTLVSEFEIDLSKVERFRQRVKFPGLLAGEAGKYRFVVDLSEDGNEWRQVASIPLKVIFRPEQAIS